MMIPEHQRPQAPQRPVGDPRNGPVFLRRELLATGWSDQVITRMLQRRTWVRVRHGAYAEATHWDGLDDAGRHGLRARAALRQAKVPVILSHVSALVEYGAPTWGLDLDVVHLTRLDGCSGRSEAGLRQHCGKVKPDEIETRNGVRLVSATRAAVETTTVAGVEASLMAINHLLHQRLTSQAALFERAALMGQWPGSLHTDLVLRLADPRVESPGESRFCHLCFTQGLPRPEPQYEVRDVDGRFVGRVDFAWPDLGVFLEFDGAVKYQKHLRPGESASEAVVREKRREDELRRITGWRCIRITWADLENPGRTAAMILGILFPAGRAA